MTPRHKFQYVRCKKILCACRFLPCQYCGINDGTSSAAHSNWAIHGKGRSIKASDVFVASLCFTCHSALDQGGKMTEPEKKAMWWAAFARTIPLLVQRGHWPAHIPVPDTATNPFD